MIYLFNRIHTNLTTFVISVSEYWNDEAIDQLKSGTSFCPKYVDWIFTEDKPRWSMQTNIMKYYVLILICFSAFCKTLISSERWFYTLCLNLTDLDSSNWRCTLDFWEVPGSLRLSILKWSKHRLKSTYEATSSDIPTTTVMRREDTLLEEIWVLGLRHIAHNLPSHKDIYIRNSDNLIRLLY